MRIGLILGALAVVQCKIYFKETFDGKSTFLFYYNLSLLFFESTCVCRYIYKINQLCVLL